MSLSIYIDSWDMFVTIKEFVIKGCPIIFLLRLVWDYELSWLYGESRLFG